MPECLLGLHTVFVRTAEGGQLNFTSRFVAHKTARLGMILPCNEIDYFLSQLIGRRPGDAPNQRSRYVKAGLACDMPMDPKLRQSSVSYFGEGKLS